MVLAMMLIVTAPMPSIFLLFVDKSSLYLLSCLIGGGDSASGQGTGQYSKEILDNWFQGR